MVRLEQYGENERRHLRDLPCPRFETTPFVTGVNISRARVAIISTAGLHLRADNRFEIGESTFRTIPGDVQARDLVMSHISTNFDRTGYLADINLVFPIDRLHELAREGVIGECSPVHFSFMGATDPGNMTEEADSLCRVLKKHGVNVVLLVPV